MSNVEQPSEHRPLAVVVLAAGKGTRMRSATAKVAHRILGRSLLGWVLAASTACEPQRSVVVVASDIPEVTGLVPHAVETAIQERQRGSGDALAAALPALADFVGDVLVVNGDGALFAGETLRAVVAGHRSAGSTATALAIPSSQDLPYGRIVQGTDGTVQRIVEAGDASPTELAIRELNAGVYCFDIATLRSAIPQLEADNSQGELYLTDLFEIIGRGGLGRTLAVVAGHEDELLGVNTRSDLAAAETVLRTRINEVHMRNGVTIQQPHTVSISPDASIEPDAIIKPGTILMGHSYVAADAEIGPYSTLDDTRVERGAQVIHSHCVSAEVGAGAVVGPFAYLRPGAALGAGSKAGTFVEIKNSVLGENTKVPHLSYIGDANIGENTNIGAGTITANYRPELGRGKQRTSVGANVRTGSDNVFVAPVTIGDGAFTGAGSIIVDDVPSGALAIARARQVNMPEYGRKLAEQAAGER